LPKTSIKYCFTTYFWAQSTHTHEQYNLFIPNIRNKVNNFFNIEFILKWHLLTIAAAFFPKNRVYYIKNQRKTTLFEKISLTMILLYIGLHKMWIAVEIYTICCCVKQKTFTKITAGNTLFERYL